MIVLIRGRTRLSSLFELHGADENDLSAAFAFTLSRSPRFLSAVLTDLGVKNPPLAHAKIRIQVHRHGEGITDVEVLVPDTAFLVFEAKTGSGLPSRAQLRQYARRCVATGLPSQLVALTNLHDSLRGHLERELPTIDGVPVQLRSWRWVRRHARQARRVESSHTIKFLLEELISFLEAFLGLETMYSNRVFVVSLASGAPRGWTTSWIDIVEKHRRYFYPVDGKGWPQPPNYMGFRYHGLLQSIHHVDKYDVVDDVREHLRGAAGGHAWGRRYLLHLGPPIRPPGQVKPGPRVRRSARVWCMLDTLLTSRTISDALTLTERREREAEKRA